MTSLTTGAADYRWRQGPRSSRRLLTAVSLLTAWCLLVGDGLAQEPTRPSLPPPPSFPIPPPPPSLSSSDAFALWNECAPINLIIEGLSDGAAAIDLTMERIQTLAESRLRAARLRAVSMRLRQPDSAFRVATPRSRRARSSDPEGSRMARRSPHAAGCPA